MRQAVTFLIKASLAIFILLMIAPATYAQTFYGLGQKWTGKETKEEAWRKKIDIDMSVPDFTTTKVDQYVMGWRLAKMVEFLQKNYRQSSYNRPLTTIRYEQTEDKKLMFAGIDKLEFVSAEKNDSVITLKWKTFTKLDKKEKVYHDIIMRFVKGVSDSETVNNLFSDVSRYIRPDEE